MKRVLAMLITMLFVVGYLTGCSKEDALSAEIIELENRASELEQEVSVLEEQKTALLSEIKDIKVENGVAKYIVTFNIRQSHFTLDISQHMKDAMNDISIQIPVDKEYFDSVEVGDTIADDFRVGSFIFKGSLGNWDVTVEAKEIR